MKSEGRSSKEPPVIRDEIPPGSVRWFEYHCLESHDSADAKLWYRSHQQVTVGVCENPEYGDLSQDERYEAGCPLAYGVKFSDGFTYTAMENELLLSQDEFYRPDPPKEKDLGVHN